MTASISPFDQRIARLDGGDLMSLLAARHAVRSFTNRPIEADAIELLQSEIASLNERFELSIQLCCDNPGAFDGRLAHYGSFHNVRNHIALVGPVRRDLDEACGYAGERLVLLAQLLGLNTCWVALTYRKKASAARVAAGEKYVCCIALGYGDQSGQAHKVKPLEKLGRFPRYRAEASTSASQSSTSNLVPIRSRATGRSPSGSLCGCACECANESSRSGC